MKKEYKGFTLVELLAVITILGLIALLASSSIASIIRGSKNDAESINIDTVLNGAYDYVQKYPNDIPDKGETTTFCAERLINCGLLKSEIIEDGQLKDFQNHVITVTYVESKNDVKDENQEVKNSKYFGKYKFTYIENNGIACTEEAVACPYLSNEKTNSK